MDHTAFPHIIDNIISNLDLDSLLSFSQTATQYREILKPHLNISISEGKSTNKLVVIHDAGQGIYAEATTTQTDTAPFLRQLKRLKQTLQNTGERATVNIVGTALTSKSLDAYTLIQETIAYLLPCIQSIRYVPGPKGNVPPLFPRKGLWRADLVNNCKARAEYININSDQIIVYHIDGTEDDVLIQSKLIPLNGSRSVRIYIDFSRWKKPLGCSPDDMDCDDTDQQTGPRMANLATHIRDMLWRCTPQVHMIDFDRVDPAWLDPTYTGSPGEDFRKHIGDFIHRAPYIPKDPIKFILRDSFEYRILNPVNA